MFVDKLEGRRADAALISVLLGVSNGVAELYKKFTLFCFWGRTGPYRARCKGQENTSVTDLKCSTWQCEHKL